VGLAAGVWSERVRPLVQHYLYELKVKRIEATAEQHDEMQKAMRVAVEEAANAKMRATNSLHPWRWCDAGSDALRRYGFQPPW
jgi:hypothetical protein